MKVIKIDNKSCDVFFGSDGWLNTEWCRFFKDRTTGQWKIVRGPVNYTWTNKKTGDKHIQLSYRPSGEQLKEIINCIKEVYGTR